MPLRHTAEVAHLLVTAASFQRYYAADKTRQNKARHRDCLQARCSKGSLSTLLLLHGLGFGDGNCTDCLVVGKQPNTPRPDPDGPCFRQEQILIGARWPFRQPPIAKDSALDLSGAGWCSKCAPLASLRHGCPSSGPCSAAI